MFPVCKEYGPPTFGKNWRGETMSMRQATPVRYEVNVNALDLRIREVWELDVNEWGKLWSVAVCIVCHGTGIDR